MADKPDIKPTGAQRRRAAEHHFGEKWACKIGEVARWIETGDDNYLSPGRYHLPTLAQLIADEYARGVEEAAKVASDAGESAGMKPDGAIVALTLLAIAARIRALLEKPRTK